MELTHEIIDITYRFAHTYLRRIGRTDIDHNDLAHDALVQIAQMRGRSTKAVDQLKQKARKEIAAVLGLAA